MDHLHDTWTRDDAAREQGPTWVEMEINKMLVDRPEKVPLFSAALRMERGRERNRILHLLFAHAGPSNPTHRRSIPNEIRQKLNINYGGGAEPDSAELERLHAELQKRLSA